MGSGLSVFITQFIIPLILFHSLLFESLFSIRTLAYPLPSVTICNGFHGHEHEDSAKVATVVGR